LPPRLPLQLHGMRLHVTIQANGHAPATLELRPLGPAQAWPQQLEEPEPVPVPARRSYPWPLLLIAAPAAVAIWSGWVRLGALCGFGLVQPFPGIVSWHLDTAITLPVGIESYAAYALYVWLGSQAAGATREFARNSALGALALGMLGQVASHLLAVAGWAAAPWPVVVGVACLPVVTLAFAAALFHRVRADARPEVTAQAAPEPPVQVTPEPVSGHPRPAAQVTPRRKAQVTPGRISDADLKGQIRAAIKADPDVTLKALAAALSRGRDRLRPLLDEVRQEGKS
jgi:hypothetical protein